MQQPYFIEYRLDDINTYEAVANYGALTQEVSNHQRVLRVTVRIGDYAIDSSSTRGDGTIELAPTDDNPLALQYALWTATDAAYKNALRAFSAKQAALKQFQSAQDQPDFAKVKPVVQVSPLVALDLDRDEWKHRIVEASGLFASDHDLRSFAENVQYSIANIRGIALNRYLVNTEGTVVREGFTGYNGASPARRKNSRAPPHFASAPSTISRASRSCAMLPSFQAKTTMGPSLSLETSPPTSSLASSFPTSKPTAPTWARQPALPAPTPPVTNRASFLKWSA
jgi:hypothetical protein